MKPQKTLLVVVLLSAFILSVLLTPVHGASTTFYGPSSYPRTQSGTFSTSVISEVISMMDQEGLNCYRMSFNDFRDINTMVIPFIQYYLSHCNYYLIVDYNHQYPMGSLSSSMLTETTNEGIQIYNAIGNNPRVMLEPWNERDNTDMPSQATTYLHSLRNAGCTLAVVIDKWNHQWSQMAAIDDPINNFYTGYHYYFNSGAWSTAESQMNTALGYGLKLINTEIGADYNEYTQFSQSEVDRVTEFMGWCAPRGIGNTVWMYQGLGPNWDKYQQLNLQWPDYLSPTPTSTPTPTPTPTPTWTPHPTPTPTPTAYPTPTPTPTSTAIPPPDPIEPTNPKKTPHFSDNAYEKNQHLREKFPRGASVAQTSVDLWDGTLISDVNYVENEKKLTVVANGEGTKTIPIYVGDWGDAVILKGSAEKIGYSPASGIMYVDVTFNSPTTFEIIWPASTSLYWLTVIPISGFCIGIFALFIHKPKPRRKRKRNH